jgi:hypothetical protein
MSGEDSAGQNTSSQHNGLDRRYGKIGILAVAAAVRCTGDERRSGAPKRVPADEALESD